MVEGRTEDEEQKEEAPTYERRPFYQGMEGAAGLAFAQHLARLEASIIDALSPIPPPTSSSSVGSVEAAETPGDRVTEGCSTATDLDSLGVADEILPECMPSLGSSELSARLNMHPLPREGPTSVGSALHNLGKCIPCKFAWSAVGCTQGSACRFCHVEHAPFKKGRPCKGKRTSYRKLVERIATAMDKGLPVPGVEEYSQPAARTHANYLEDSCWRTSPRGSRKATRLPHSRDVVERGIAHDLLDMDGPRAIGRSMQATSWNVVWRESF
mmetsp:Transcript_137376/g.342638  ORF Transcript_137376/g.342638 Transcript_137376/m.342638 type:complete len:270 (+) Transcript_137376:77-886(+)